MADDFRVNDPKLVYTEEELRGERSIEITTTRPTVTRTVGGLVVGGPLGALLGFAWRKKSKQKVRLP